MRKVGFLAALVAAALVANSALAQERQNDNRNREGANSAQQLTRADSQIAYCVEVDNWLEVEATKAVQAQLQDESLKRFAEKMVEEHAQVLEEFASLHKNSQDHREDRRNENRDRPQNENVEESRGNDAAQRAPAADDDEQTAPVEAHAVRDQAQAQRAASRRGLPFLRVKQQMAEQCLQTIRQELDAKNPDEIDQCFITHQVYAHTSMIDSLTVLQEFASPNLSPRIEELIQTTRQHLEEAKQLMKRLDDEQSSAARASG